MRKATRANARSCLWEMKENGAYFGERIGKVVKEFSGMASGPYVVGSYVLFRVGESLDRQGRKSLTVEVPLTQAEIEQRKKSGERIFTIGCVVGVPADRVKKAA